MPYQNMIPQIISLMPVLSKNHTKDHRAERNACFVSRVVIYSPAKAPIIGPIINPMGGRKNKPKTIPMIDQRVPTLVPPYCLVHRRGMRQSPTTVARVSNPNTNKVSAENCIVDVQCKKSKPRNDKGGHGNIGAIAPINHARIRRNQTTIKKTSILLIKKV